MTRLRRTVSLAACLLLLAPLGARAQHAGRGGAAVPACERTVDLPAPSGPYAVGVATRHWVDADRPEERTPDPNDLRQLMATVAYPASTGGHPAPYVPELSSMIGGLRAGGRPGPRGLDEYVATFACVETDSFEGAPVAAGGPFPVVVLSPGGNVSRHWHTALAQELASHGYVVAVLSHAYNGLDVFPLGGLLTSSPYWNEDDPAINDELTERYATDAAFALDRLDVLGGADPLLAGHLDLGRVAAVGYSRGGRAANRGCGRDARVRACVAFESSPPEGTPGLDKPQMTMRVPWRPARAGALRRHLAANTRPAYEVVLDGGTHFSFTDLPFIVPGRFDSEVDPGRAHAVIGAYTLAFLDAFLRGRKARLRAAVTAPPAGVAVWANAAGSE